MKQVNAIFSKSKRIFLFVALVGCVFFQFESGAQQPESQEGAVAVKPADERRDQPTVLQIEDDSPEKPVLEAGTSTEMILDASGSMKAKLSGRVKLAQAKRVLHAYMLQSQKENVRLALRVYGLQEKNCKDSKLVLKFGETGLDAIDRSLDQVNPKGYGKTPLAYSLEEAAKDLAKQPKPRRLVVVTDGVDTCGGDPCEIAKKLKREHDVKIFVVSYAVNPEDQKKLKCMADFTGGVAFSAKTTLGLLRALNRSDTREEGKNLFVKSPDPLAVVRIYEYGKEETEPRTVFKTFVADSGTRVKPGRYKVEVEFRRSHPYVFPNVVIEKGERKVLVVEGKGSLFVKFFDRMLNVEVQNQNGAHVMTSTSDVEIPLDTNYYKLKVFSKPFSSSVIEDVPILPNDRWEEQVTDFGVLKAVVSPKVSPVPIGFYVYDETKKMDLGSFVTGFPFALPIGAYTLKSAGNLFFQNLDVRSRTLREIEFLPSKTPFHFVEKQKKAGEQPEEQINEVN